MNAFFEHLLLQSFGHAAQNANDLVCSDLLDPLIYFFLCGFSDGTGVQQDDIGLTFIISLFIFCGEN